MYIITVSGENAKVTNAFDLKFMSTAKLIPRPLVREGNISETISQLIGPKDICKKRIQLCDDQ
jgi:hypothetical protein